MLYDPYCAPASSRTTQPSTGRAVYTAVISDKCTFLRGKCKSFPVILGHAAAGGNTGSTFAFIGYDSRLHGSSGHPIQFG